ncbi:MAG: IS1634 family transposase [Actinobacteria bacterium]|nr:IS1634 family transposase [Actinomycetota bacterium]
MAHFHIKKKRGRPYLYVREIARVDGKPKVVSQVYVGSPEKVAALAKGELTEEIKLRVEEFGALFVANLMDEDVDLAGIVNAVVGRGGREEGLSVGEYFLYAVLNRMVEAKSKRALAEWYEKTAVQQIRPTDVSRLSSQRYWERWERVSEEDLAEISRRFFQRIAELERPRADCLLLDTTNYYTYMATHTPSDLARRGHNKEGKHHLRQVGLGLLAERESGLPLWWCAYPGNLHDSRLFSQVLEEFARVLEGLAGTKERLTVVMDKGMNADANYAVIDEHRRIHFVTTYSLAYAPELARIPLSRYAPAATGRNRRLCGEGREEERLSAYRTTGTFWGKERAVVLTYNPRTARKQEHVFSEKLAQMREELLSMRALVREGAPHWRDERKVLERYARLCERLHLPTHLYEVSLEKTPEGLAMEFRKNQHATERRQALFGKNMIVTDNTDWTTEEIIEASLARWEVEDAFRLSKDCDLVGVQPIRHFTDSKIRCHLFCCVAALAYLRRLEKKLAEAGVKRTAKDVMEDMRHLHSVLSIADKGRTPVRKLEMPTKTQAEVLRALGYQVNKRGVLQSLAR